MSVERCASANPPSEDQCEQGALDALAYFTGQCNAVPEDHSYGWGNNERMKRKTTFMGRTKNDQSGQA